MEYNNNRVVTAIGKAIYINSDGRTIFGDKLVAVIAFDGELRTIDAYKNTKVVTERGTTATADELNYLGSSSVAKMSGNVEIFDKGNVMRGAHAEIDFGNDISRILSKDSGKRVSGVLIR